MSTYRQDIINAALRNGVPPEVALSVAQQESGIRQYDGAGNVIRGSAGEIGMFQVKPEAGADVGAGNLFNPQQNIEAGVAYLRKMFDWTGTGSWSDALAAYNGGIGKWQRGTTPPEAWGYSSQVLSRAPSVAVPDYVTSPQYQPSFSVGDPVFYAGVSEQASPTALFLILGLLGVLAVSQA